MGPGIVPQPPRCAPTSPKPSPRGEGTPVRTLGRMRGRSCTQPFLVEKRGTPAYRPNGIFLLPRWATRSPPHPSPSVTASPQGEASGLCSPTRKKRPKSGHVHGHRTSPTTVPLRPATPKRASGNERALKKGGRGPSPATLCVRAFSRESLDPRPGPGGNPPRRCQPAPVPVGAATDDGDPQGAAPRGTVRATTTQRVRSTLSGSRPESGGKPPRRY